MSYPKSASPEARRFTQLDRAANRKANQLAVEDRAAHEWYRFVLSFPPHLVRTYLDRFRITGAQRVLDPFCGTGTTVVECKKLGIPGIGIEANPMARFAGNVKVDWRPDPEGLLSHAEKVADAARGELSTQGIEDFPAFPGYSEGSRTTALRTLPSETQKLLLTNSISPLPLHKTLVLLDQLQRHADEKYIGHEKLALANALINQIGNLHFGPEVGVGPAKADAPVIAAWFTQVKKIADDLRELADRKDIPSTVYQGDSRQVADFLAPGSIDAVITSPPYPNEKDYTRTTRLESVLLGFIRNKNDLQSLKRGLMRSNTRNVYKGDDDDQWVASHSEISRIAEEIERRRIELGKTSGFERLYARVTKLYFGGMARHLAELRTYLRPGAQLAYVVGDQASYLRVMIRTGQLIADIARTLGYEVTGIDLFRTRIATATREQLREEVVILRWP